MANLFYPSVKMLPMDDIRTELGLTFLNNQNNSVDTNNVYGELAENIAIAHKNENGIVTDRNTVDNALNLNGVPAEDYLTRTQGADIVNQADNLTKILTDEISALRDELYQLRGELTRNGYVKEYGLYAGFQDYFNTDDKKYIYTTTNGEDTIALCTLSSNFVNSANVSKIIPSQSGIIQIGDWFIISKTDTGESYLVQATDVQKLNTEEEVTFVSSVSSQGIPSIDNPSNVIITKIQGSYVNGTFSFSEVAAQAITGKEKYTLLNDDTTVTLQTLTTNKTGYGIQFKVPNNVKGALKEFHIVARAKGTPGPLTCYLIDPADYSSIKDLEAEEIGEDKRVLAKSTPIGYESANSINLTDIAFTFFDPQTYKYPILEGKTYIFVVTVESASASNYWDIQFTSGEVQTNNLAYSYSDLLGISLTQSLGDMIFSLTTIDIGTNVETPYNEGLYTSQVIKVNDYDKLSRARLTLRINKEGNYICSLNTLINDGGVIRLKTQGNHPADLGLNNGDTIIIGTEIRKTISICDNNNVSIDKSILIPDNAQVYRVGYRPYIKAVKRVWDPVNSYYVVSNETLVPMTLKTVIPDDKKIAENRSDRLIFECDFTDTNGNLIDANEFILQIVWKSNLTKTNLASYPDYIGRIYDLTLSFDKTL